jgi:chemotaxis protein CheC
MVIEAPALFAERLSDSLEFMKKSAARQASQDLASVARPGLRLSRPQALVLPTEEVPYLVGGPESEAVGLFLRAEGDIPGRLFLVLEMNQACDLVALATGEQPSARPTLNLTERSLLAAFGNLAGTFFLEALAAGTGLNTRTAPQAVVVDRAGAILSVMAAAHGGASPYALMVHGVFLDEETEREVQADFCVIPDPDTLSAIPMQTPTTNRLNLAPA